MLNNRRFTAIIGGVLAIATVIALLGLPFAQFAVSHVSAEYNEEAGTCGDKPTYQVRFNRAEVVVYSSADLTNFVAVVPNAELQKFLLCDNADTRPEGYVSIFFPVNQKLYVNSADVADITCRNDGDGEVGPC